MLVYYMSRLFTFIKSKRMGGKNTCEKSMSLQFCYIRCLSNATLASGQLAHVLA